MEKVWHPRFAQYINIGTKVAKPVKDFIIHSTMLPTNFKNFLFGPHKTKGIASEPAKIWLFYHQKNYGHRVALAWSAEPLLLEERRARSSLEFRLSCLDICGLASTASGPATNWFDRLISAFGHYWTFKILYCSILNCSNTFVC